jgi:RibD C-terminal domain
MHVHPLDIFPDLRLKSAVYNTKIPMQPPYIHVNRCDLVDCFDKLHATHGVGSILVEGGAGIIQSVLERELADQVVVTIRPCYLGGYRAMNRELLQPVSLIETTAASVGGDVILYGKIQRQRDSSSSNISTGIDTGTGTGMGIGSEGSTNGNVNGGGSCRASASASASAPASVDDSAASSPKACSVANDITNGKNERLDVKFIGLQ